MEIIVNLFTPFIIHSVEESYCVFIIAGLISQVKMFWDCSKNLNNINNFD